MRVVRCEVQLRAARPGAVSGKMGQRSDRRRRKRFEAPGTPPGPQPFSGAYARQPASGESHTVTTVSQRPLKDPPSLELVLKRNPVERLKREKSPLGMLDELPALIATGYEDVPEEDIVRLKGWGLYHDKPKVGAFIMRIKLPAGRTTPEQLRVIGELSTRHGRSAAELSTRQNVQLHY